MVKAKVCVCISTTLILVLFCIFLFLMSTVNPKPLVSSNTTKSLKRMAEEVYDVVFPLPQGNPIYGLEKASEADKRNQSIQLEKLMPLYNNLVRKGLVSSNPKIKDSEPTIKSVRRSVKDTESRPRNIDQNTDVVLKIIDDSGHSRIEIKLAPKGNFEGAKRSYRSLPYKSNDNYKDTLNKYEDIIGGDKRIVINILNDKMVFDDKSHVNIIHKNSTKSYCPTCNDSSAGNINKIDSNEMETNFNEITITIHSDVANNENVSMTKINVNDTDVHMFNSSTYYLKDSINDLTDRYLNKVFNEFGSEQVTNITTPSQNKRNTTFGNFSGDSTEFLDLKKLFTSISKTTVLI